MSLLDTFTILFENKGATETKRAQDEATASAEKTATQLEATGRVGEQAGHRIAETNSRVAESFDVIKEHAGELTETLIEHALEVAAAFQALFAVEKLVDNFFETAEQSDKLGERARSIGVETEVLDAWGNAAKRVGGSAEAFGESILGVTRQLTRFEETGQSRILPFFTALGVSMTDAKGKAKDLFTLLPELAKATEGKSKQETAGALRGIGFDEGTIRLLQRGGKELDELLARQKKLGLVTAEDAEAAEKFNIEWDDVKQLFHTLTVELDTYLLPILEKFLDAVEELVEFISAHKYLIEGFFAAIVIGALAAIGPVTLLGYGVNLLIGAFLILTSPITAVIAVILALSAVFALVYEDIKKFEEGSNSVTGEILKRWPIVGEVFKEVKTIIGDFWQFCKSFFKFLSDVVLDPINAFHTLRDEVGKVIDFLERKFGSLKAIIDGAKNIAGTISDKLGEFGGAIKGELRHAGAIIGGREPGFLFPLHGQQPAPVPGGIGGAVPDLPAAQAAIDATHTPLASQTAASLAAAGQAPGVVNNVNVAGSTINAQSNDPGDIAKAVDQHMTTHVDTAINHLADGVSH